MTMFASHTLQSTPKPPLFIISLSDTEPYFHGREKKPCSIIVCPECNMLTALGNLEGILNNDNPTWRTYICNHCKKFSKAKYWEVCTQTLRLNSIYFQNRTRLTIPHFRLYLEYLNENYGCNCYWPELNQLAYCAKYSNQQDFSFLLWNLPESYSPYFDNSPGQGDLLAAHIFFYSQTHNIMMDLAQKIEIYQPDTKVATHCLDQIYKKLRERRNLFYELYSNCLEKHPHPKIVYELGLIFMHAGNYPMAFDYIEILLDMQKTFGFELTSEMYQQEAKVYAELGMYDKSIAALNKLIENEPYNQEAYFQRAVAYFEIGDFEHSVEDYMKYHIPGCTTGSLPSNEFIDAFTLAAISSSKESLKNFVPSLCNTIYGMGAALWTFGEHPVDTVNELAAISYEFGNEIYKLLKNIDKEYLDQCDEKLRDFFLNFNQLDDKKKGEALGNFIGTYGVDFVTGILTTKGAHYASKLKRANQVCNLETYATSSKASQKAFKAAAAEINLQRASFFKRLKFIGINKTNIFLDLIIISLVGA